MFWFEAAISQKRARLSFENTVFEKVTRVYVSKLHEKPYYYLIFHNTQKSV